MGSVLAARRAGSQQAARDFTKTWAVIESGGEEVIVKRNRRRIAGILPEPSVQTALEVFGDLHGVLQEPAGSALTRKLAELRADQRRQGTLREVRNPWASPH